MSDGGSLFQQQRMGGVGFFDGGHLWHTQGHSHKTICRVRGQSSKNNKKVLAIISFRLFEPINPQKPPMGISVYLRLPYA